MINEKALDLANHISRKKRGSKDEIRSTDPEYLILEPVITEEMADVALHMQIRQKTTAAQLAPLCGKSKEDTHRILMQLAQDGVCFVNTIDGEDTFWYDTWVPGIMEMMVNNKQNVRKHPQIAEAFEAYGRVRGPKTAGAFPVGVGLMRVIPIQSAIDGNSRRASYEEVNHYLDENTVFSVSDCSCRTARQIMGEGCGHLKEDMCIQMGHAAEYYIRTGRGRAITREEARDILRRAEENGLMHQIPNLDGSGKTHAICNCCGCGCLSLRSAEMFLNGDMVRSNYVSIVDKDKCVACGECAKTCPVNALQLGQKLCARKPVVSSLTREETPRNTEWTPDKWNPDYRTNRKNVVDTGTSPCKTKCPAHISVQGYIKLASQGRYRDALELIKQENPFPAVCGRICPRGCESECTRGDIDDPIAIDEIKKFIAEQDRSLEHRYVPQKRHQYGKRIAVVGAGPSGLSCAYYLAIDGYQVTVFEKQTLPGGMLTLGIPAFRLGNEVVQAEIDILRELGVELRTGVEVGCDVTLQELRDQGYEAFYLAIGAQDGRRLGIPGEDTPGVQTGVDFLRRVNLGEDLRLCGSVVVIGGGNVAIDVARTAIRTGGDTVGMVCLEGPSEMPALPEEIDEAKSEGISITHGWGPLRVLSANGRVVGVEFKKCVSVFDKNHRFAPQYDETRTMTVPADHVLVSVGQAIAWGGLLEGSTVQLNPNRTAQADAFTLQSGEPDVFVGGDAMTGPRFAIDAIAQGKEAAISIHRYVQPGQSLVLGRDRREYRALDKDNLDLQGYDRRSRQQAGHNDAGAARQSFQDPRKTFSEEQMLQETARCLGCGAVITDEYLCVGCGACTTRCRFDAIRLERRYDGAGVAFEHLKPVVIRNILRRKARITAKKVRRVFQRK